MMASSDGATTDDIRFGILDYIVFAMTLLVSSGIGIYYRFTGGRQRTAEEYLLGNKNMSPVR
jgi:sodium-coupled monocarboxylate transporter 8/12